MTDDYIPVTVVAYEEKILLYLGSPPNTESYRFKELIPGRFSPHLRSQEEYERLKEKAEVLGEKPLTENQMHAIAHKNSDIGELLEKFLKVDVSKFT